MHWIVLRLLSSCGVLKPTSLDLDPLACGDLGLGTHTYGGLMAFGCYMIISMSYPFDHAYESHKVLQTSGDIFVPLFWGVGTLMVMNIDSGAIGYVFNDMETLKHDDVWSYLWLYGYWDVYGVRSHIFSFIFLRII